MKQAVAWTGVIMAVGVVATAAWGGGEQAPAVVPQPVELRQTGGEFVLTDQTTIVAEEELRGVAGALQGMLGPATGYALEVVGEGRGPGAIVLRRSGRLTGRLGREGYRLTVQPEGVVIEGAEAAGVYWGCQTLRQLLPAEIYRPARVEGMAWAMPCVEIEDCPRFSWRGLHLDVSRHFLPKEFVKKYLDLMALHKLNVFHWHLTDDQGWRLEVKRYPRLTEVGAWRRQTQVGRSRERPRRFDGKPHGGYYSQADVREIVAYARERFITVLPEIDVPGHTQAAIAAYPQLGAARPGGPAPEVLTYWGGCEVVLNATEETMAFVQGVLEEVLELFPGAYIHVGGDEVDRALWREDARTAERLGELDLKSLEELQGWFVRRLDAFLTERGRRLVGWDEILEGGLAAGATVMSWRGEAGGVAAARAGHDVVMTPADFTYFDHYQGDPNAEPLAIGGFTPLERVYGYEPIPPELTAAQARHVLGAQGQLWTEYVPDARRAEYMAYPRACALAEVVWTPAERKHYQDFLRRLETHLKRLTALDVNYRPAEGARGSAGREKTDEPDRHVKPRG